MSFDHAHDQSDHFDFIGIGDMATDAFIRLKDARVNCDIDTERCQLCVAFGEKIPYEFVDIVPAVGNSANASVCAARLGLRSALVSNLGDDYVGNISIETLKENGVDTRFVEVHKNAKSNYHYVLWYEAERTILVKHERYPYRLPDIDAPSWVYVSSLSEHAGVFQEEILRYLKDHPKIKLAFQPGTFQINMGYAKLRDLYRRADIFFCNTSEAAKILQMKKAEVGALLKGLHSYGPKIVVVTDGPKGAYAYDGKEMWFMPPYPDPKPPYERTGAGDAFASTVVAALSLGKPLETALKWASINAMSVVQHVGAQRGLLSEKETEEYLGKAPKDFHPMKIV